PGVSETIRVTSIVDKFLEHSRIFYFENDGKPDVFLGSADWMPRNFFRRIEVMFPIEDARLKARVVEEILPTVLADTVKARVQRSNGNYVRATPAPDRLPLRSQLALQSLARESAREGPAAPPARDSGDDRRSERRATGRRRPRARLRPSDGAK